MPGSGIPGLKLTGTWPFGACNEPAILISAWNTAACKTGFTPAQREKYLSTDYMFTVGAVSQDPYDAIELLQPTMVEETQG
jgi:hypothetical protein